MAMVNRGILTRKRRVHPPSAWIGLIELILLAGSLMSHVSAVSGWNIFLIGAGNGMAARLPFFHDTKEDHQSVTTDRFAPVALSPILSRLFPIWLHPLT